MSTHPLDRVLMNYKRKMTIKPVGTYSLEECATRWRSSIEETKRMINEMKQAKIVVEIAGKKENSLGKLINCIYYKFPDAK